MRSAVLCGCVKWSLDRVLVVGIFVPLQSVSGQSFVSIQESLFVMFRLGALALACRRFRERSEYEPACLRCTPKTEHHKR